MEIEALRPKEVELFKKRGDSDEVLVRKELVRVWTRVMEKYARPGTPLPSAEALRRELIKTGVDAGVDAVVDEHWFLFSFMIRDRIQSTIEEQLQRFDLQDFMADVKAAQTHPEMVPLLRDRIRYFVLEYA